MRFIIAKIKIDPLQKKKIKLLNTVQVDEINYLPLHYFNSQDFEDKIFKSFVVNKNYIYNLLVEIKIINEYNVDKDEMEYKIDRISILDVYGKKNNKYLGSLK